MKWEQMQAGKSYIDWQNLLLLAEELQDSLVYVCNAYSCFRHKGNEPSVYRNRNASDFFMTKQNFVITLSLNKAGSQFTYFMGETCNVF